MSYHLDSEILQDRGCWDQGRRVAEKCTECPLAECKYDNPSYLYQWRREAKIQKIIENDLSQGSKRARFNALALELGVSRRTIWRWFKLMEEQTKAKLEYNNNIS